MEKTWKFICLCLVISFLKLCNGLPIHLERTIADPHIQLLSGLIAIILTICTLLLLAGCLCCQRGTGFKEFRDSPVAISTAGSVDNGLVNPTADGAFTIFAPLSHRNHTGSSERFRLDEDYVYGDINISSWFNEGEYNFPRAKLKYIQELGKGWFGKVVEGTAQDLEGDHTWTAVVVRILDSTASTKERVFFLHEAEIYRCGDHTNILKLYGRCLDSVPLLLLQEFCPQGDLKSYLLSNKPNVENLLSSEYPLIWCCQITSAVKFLHEKGLAHSDLACRNCQLTSNLTLKLGDYGLASSRYPEDYYEGISTIPIRWCAPESIRHTNTTIQTERITREANVWSLAVCFWEICECGKRPYQQFTDDEVVTQVLGKANVRLPRPSYGVLYTDYIYRLMQSCWLTPESRPTSTQIYLTLTDLFQVFTVCKAENQGSMGDSQESQESFDMRWNSLKPNNLNTSNNSTDASGDKQAKSMSPSMNNLIGSLEDMNRSRNFDEDNAHSILLPSQLHQKFEFKLGPQSREPQEPDSLNDSMIYTMQRSSSSETEEENWKTKIERGAYTEKVRQKSRSVTDLMVLTHIDCSESESETPLPSLDHRVNYKNVRLAPKHNLERLSYVHGSEGNLLNVEDDFQAELKKLQVEHRDSLFFVPDKYSQNVKNEQINNNLEVDENSCLVDSSERLFKELSSTSEIKPANQVFNVFNVTIDKFSPVHLVKLNEIINLEEPIEVSENKTFVPYEVPKLCDIIQNNSNVANLTENNEIEILRNINEAFISNERQVESIFCVKIENVTNTLAEKLLDDLNNTGCNNTKDDALNEAETKEIASQDIKDEVAFNEMQQEYILPNLKEKVSTKVDRIAEDITVKTTKISSDVEENISTMDVSLENEEQMQIDSSESLEIENEYSINKSEVSSSDKDNSKICRNVFEQYVGQENVFDEKLFNLECVLENSEDIVKDKSSSEEDLTVTSDAASRDVNCGTEEVLQLTNAESFIDESGNLENISVIRENYSLENGEDKLADIEVALSDVGTRDVNCEIEEILDLTKAESFIAVSENHENTSGIGENNSLVNGEDELATLRDVAIRDTNFQIGEVLDLNNAESCIEKLENISRIRENDTLENGEAEMADMEVPLRGVSSWGVNGEIEEVDLNNAELFIDKNENRENISGIQEKDSLENGEAEMALIEAPLQSERFCTDGLKDEIREVPDRINDANSQMHIGKITNVLEMTESEPIERISTESTDVDKTASQKTLATLQVDHENNEKTETKGQQNKMVKISDESPPPSKIDDTKEEINENSCQSDTGESILPNEVKISKVPKLIDLIENNDKLMDYIIANYESELNDDLSFETSVKTNSIKSNTTVVLKTEEEENSSDQEPEGSPLLNFDISDSQDTTNPNSLTHLNVFSNLRTKQKSLDFLSSTPSKKSFSSLRDTNGDIPDFTDNTNLNYSLETWDNFLGRAIDSQNQDINDHTVVFESMNSEPQSLLFIETDERNIMMTPPNSDIEVSLEDQPLADVYENQTINIQKGDDDLDGTFLVEGREMDETYDASLLNTTFNVNDDPMEEQGASGTWESNGGWFLHPQSSSSVSGSMTEQKDTGSYVRFGMDDEILAALRGELLAKLPHAQGTSSLKMKENEEEWDPTEKDEVFLRYNVYNTPLSPIPEENENEEFEDSACTTPGSPDSGASDDWPEKFLEGAATRDVESPSLKAQDLHHQHTLSQDSCCSNDTLFNLEDMTCGALEQEEESESDDSQTIEKSEDKRLREERIRNEAINYFKDGTALGVPLESPVMDLESPMEPLPDKTYIMDFLVKEREHSELVSVVVTEVPSDNPSDSNSSKSVPLNKHVAPLPSPDDHPWKQLSASLLSYDRFQKKGLMDLEHTALNDAESETQVSTHNCMYNTVENNENNEGSVCINEENRQTEPAYTNINENNDGEENLPDYVNVEIIDKVDTVNNVYEKIENSEDILNEADYVNITNLENCKINAGYTNLESTNLDEKFNHEYANTVEPIGEDLVIRDIEEEEQDDDIFGVLTDIRFSGPGEPHLMSTSFSESNDINNEQDWDSGSDTRSSSSGEFIWKEGEHEESLKALQALPQDPLDDIKLKEANQEETSSSSCSDEEGECPEFIPSAWDKYATPTKSSLRSPEKTLEKEEKKKGVWFKKQRYHCVYEYPREPESPVLQSFDLWNNPPPVTSYPEWYFDIDSGGEFKEFSSASTLSPDTLSTDFNTGFNNEFFVTSSATPFDMMGGTSQFFPGGDQWSEVPKLNENTTPDSGVEDITPGSLDRVDFGRIEPSLMVPSLKLLSETAYSKLKQRELENRSNEILGGLRHTRDKLKLDLPPSPNTFTSNKTFNLDPNVEPVVLRERPSFTTFGKSRFSVQHVDTPDEDIKGNNVCFEALPYKPPEKREIELKAKKIKKEEEKGEASLLDSADEDSGIESSTLERKSGNIVGKLIEDL